MPMLFGFFLLGILHIFNTLQDAMYPGSPRLNADTVGPADFEVTYGSSVLLAYIKQPVENVIVIFGIHNEFICAVEDRGSFGVYKAAGTQERSICRGFSGRFGIVDETFLT